MVGRPRLRTRVGAHLSADLTWWPVDLDMIIMLATVRGNERGAKRHRKNTELYSGVVKAMPVRMQRMRRYVEAEESAS